MDGARETHLKCLWSQIRLGFHVCFVQIHVIFWFDMMVWCVMMAMQLNSHTVNAHILIAACKQWQATVVTTQPQTTTTDVDLLNTMSWAHTYLHTWFHFILTLHHHQTLLWWCRTFYFLVWLQLCYVDPLLWKQGLNFLDIRVNCCSLG